MKFKRTVLKNGLRVITVPLKSNLTTTVLILVEAGSNYENARLNGISHFLEHMCFKGTKDRDSDKIVYELDSIGASYNAFTSHEYTGYYAKSEKKHLPKIFDVISDIYLNSTFPELELEKEKGVVIEEIKMYEDLPQEKVSELLQETVYGKKQPAGWPIAGTPKKVSELKQQDLIEYHARHYVPKATTIVIAGNFNEAKILEDVRNRFGGVSKRQKADKVPVFEKQNKPRIGVHYKMTDQTHFQIGIRAFDVYDKRNATLLVLDYILGGGMSSRLFKKMRNELSICYYIESGTSSRTDHGLFEIAAGVPAGRLDEAIRAILNELKLLKDEPVSEKELQKVKDYFLGRLFMGLEASNSFASYFGNQEILRLKIKTPEEWAAEIRRVSARDIKKLAGELFTDERLNLAVIGPIKDTSSMRKVLKF